MPVREVEGIQKTQVTDDMPGCAEIGSSGDAAAAHGAGKGIVAYIGPGNAPIKCFVVTKYVGITTGVADAGREIQILPVIRLHAELFSGGVRTRSFLARVAESGATRRIDIS